MPELTNRSIIPLAKEGFPLIGLSTLFTLISALFHLGVLTFFLLILTTLLVNFFRDPDRIIPTDDGLVVSPADGKVIAIEKITENGFLHSKAIRISVFMTIFDVHVNRVPCDGKVSDIKHRRGKFFSAHKARASLENEKNTVLLDTEDGRQILVVQVAGFIARRIRCWVKPGDLVKRGERFGMIQFGSRLDVYLPLNSKVMIKRGQKVRAGESVLCLIV